MVASRPYRVCKKCYRVQTPEGAWLPFAEVPQPKIKNVAYGLCLWCSETLYADREEIRTLLIKGEQEYPQKKGLPAQHLTV